MGTDVREELQRLRDMIAKLEERVRELEEIAVRKRQAAGGPL